jgi:hypothetical protein
MPEDFQNDHGTLRVLLGIGIRIPQRTKLHEIITATPNAPQQQDTFYASTSSSTGEIYLANLL